MNPENDGLASTFLNWHFYICMEVHLKLRLHGPFNFKVPLTVQVLHSNHVIMVSVKYSLAKMYGRMLGYEATTLTGIKYDILDG